MKRREFVAAVAVTAALPAVALADGVRHVSFDRSGGASISRWIPVVEIDRYLAAGWSVLPPSPIDEAIGIRVATRGAV